MATDGDRRLVRVVRGELGRARRGPSTRTWPVRSPERARVPSAPTADGHDGIAVAVEGGQLPGGLEALARELARSRRPRGSGPPASARARGRSAPRAPASPPWRGRRASATAAPPPAAGGRRRRGAGRRRRRPAAPPRRAAAARRASSRTRVHRPAAGDPQGGGVAHAGGGHDRRLQPHEGLEAAAREVPDADAAVEGGGRAPLAVGGDRDRGHRAAKARPARVRAVRWP